jgi:hypothetical protein
LAVVALCVGVLAMAAGGGDSGPSKAKQRREVEDYQAKLLPLVQQWGKIEVDGMRPAISDLSRADEPQPDPATDDEDIVVPPEAIVGEAQAWRASLMDLRRKIAALPAPTSLTRAKLLFDKAMVRYIDAATVFEQAASGPAAQRKAKIADGIAAATDGAALYNDASLVLQAARKRVGLAPSTDFPNHKAGEEEVS